MSVKSIFKFLLYSIIILIITVVISLLGANTWLNSKLDKGNLDLSLIKSYVFDILNDSDLYTIEADALEMSKTPDGQVLLYFKNVNFYDHKNIMSIETPTVIIENQIITYALGSLSNLFTGGHLKSNVSVIRPKININLDKSQVIESLMVADDKGEQVIEGGEISQSISFDIENKLPVKDHFYQIYFRYLHSLLSSKSDNELNSFLSLFSSLALKDADIGISSFGNNINFNNLQINFLSDDQSRNLVVTYPMNKTEDDLGVAISIKNNSDSALTNIDITFKNLIPDNFINSSEKIGLNSFYNGALSGRLNANINNLGRITDSTLDLNVSQGAMEISLPYSKTDILEIEDAYISSAYNSADQAFNINELVLEQDGYNVKSKGALYLNYNELGNVFEIDTTLTNLTIEKDKNFIIENSDLNLNINLNNGNIIFEEFSGQMGEGEILITNTQRIDYQEYKLLLSNANAIDIKSLINNIDSLNFAQWFKSNVNEAKINEILWSFKILDSGEFIDSDLSMDFENSSFYYYDTHPPINNASGNIGIKDQSIIIELSKGEMNLVDDQSIDINSIKGSILGEGKDQTANFSLELDSDINNLWSYLEIAQFNNLDIINQKEQLKGQASINSVIEFPIPLKSSKDLEIEANILIEEGRYILSEQDSLIIPNAKIDFRNNTIKTNGELNYKGIASKFTTITSLDADLSTEINLSTSVSPTEINILQPFFGEFVGGFGRVPTDIKIVIPLNDLENIEQMELRANLTDIITQYPPLNWRKGVNERAELKSILTKVPTEDDIEKTDYNIKFLYDSDSVFLDGYFLATSDFKAKNLIVTNFSSPKVQGLKFDVQIDSEGAGNVYLEASKIDISSFIDSDIFMRSNQNIPIPNLNNINLNVLEIDKVIGKNGEDISSINGRINLNDGKIKEMDLAGNFNQNQDTLIQIVYRGAESDLPVDLGVTTDDGGAFLRFMGIYNQAQEGYMQLRATGRNINNMTGQMGIEDILVSDDANLVKIFAESGPNPNRPDIYNVRFKLLKTEFQIEDELIYVNDMQLFGPSDRLKLQGKSNSVTGRFKFQGDYCADYLSNASFGSIPLFGPLLSGGSENCLSATPIKIERDKSGDAIYSSINPIGTVAPGIFRDLFDYN